MEDGSSTEQVAELSRLFSAAKAQGRRLQRKQRIATFALLGVVAAFATAIYVKVESMYTAENFQACLGPQLEELGPHVKDTVRDVVERAGPHYAKLGRERLEALLPQVRESLGAELMSLTDGLARSAEERVSLALERVEKGQFERLRKHFPELEEKRFAELRNQWAVEVQEDTVMVLGEFQERVLVDLSNLNNTIETFGPNKYDDFERDALVRYYAHLWLTLADEEILTGESAGGRDG